MFSLAQEALKDPTLSIHFLEWKKNYEAVKEAVSVLQNGSSDDSDSSDSEEGGSGTEVDENEEKTGEKSSESNGDVIMCPVCKPSQGGRYASLSVSLVAIKHAMYTAQLRARNRC